MVTINDFKKIELRIAKILEAEEHPNADKLYVLKVDLGDSQKQLVAGIRGFYTKEELVGRQVVVIQNLEPATIRGVESAGMVLVAQDREGLSLLIPDKEMQLGACVR